MDKEAEKNSEEVESELGKFSSNILIFVFVFVFVFDICEKEETDKFYSNVLIILS